MFTVCSHWVHSCFGRFGIAKGVGKSLLFVAAGADFSFFSQLFFDFRSFLFSHRVGLLTSRGLSGRPLDSFGALLLRNTVPYLLLAIKIHFIRRRREGVKGATAKPPCCNSKQNLFSEQHNIACLDIPSGMFTDFQRAFRSPSGLLRASSPMK